MLAAVPTPPAIPLGVVFLLLISIPVIVALTGRYNRKRNEAPRALDTVPPSPDRLRFLGGRVPIFPPSPSGREELSYVVAILTRGQSMNEILDSVEWPELHSYGR
jgi:hypothetical protein